MLFIVTPGQFAKRAEFYQQLGQLTGAGIGLIRALEQIKRQPPARSYQEPLRRLLEELIHGFTLTEALRRLGRWLPSFDLALLSAGEVSGRLENCFRLLADYYRDRARLARQMLADLAYPLFLFHFAVFILPFSRLFISGDWVAYLVQTLGVLLPCYLVMALVVYAAQSRHGETWRAVVESVLDPIPVLGKGRRCLALARLAAALEGLLSAGVTVIEAWELSAAASGSPFLRRTVLAWRPAVDAGQTPAEAVMASGAFPEMFASQYSTGELSGKLEETLRGLHNYYQEEGLRKLHALAQWTPRAVYLLVALLIAYKVVSFYGSYFKQIQDAGGFG
jgi:type II secretory pathway component PulF